jgi:hypothetical protein
LGWNVTGSSVLVMPQTDALVVDLPYTEITVDVALEGAPVGVAELSGPDVPTLAVRRSVGAANPGPGNGGGGPGGPSGRPLWLDLPPLFDPVTGDLDLPMTIRLFDADYDIAYRNDRAPEDLAEALTEWPLNVGIVSTFHASDGITLALNIESVEVEVQVTLDGEELSPANTSPENHGRLRLLSSQTFSPIWTLPPFVNDAGDVASTLTLQLLPDRYHVGYTSEDRGLMPDWPVDLAGGFFIEDVDLTAPGALVVDVPVIELNIISNHPDEAAGAPIVRLSGPMAPGVIGLESQGWIPMPSAEGTWLDYEPLRVVPGSYRVLYVPDLVEDDWPHSTFMIRENLQLPEDVTVSMDLGFRRLALTWTLDGDPDASAQSTETDHGTLLLTRPNPRSTWGWDLSASRWETHPVNLPPGTYLVHYYPAQGLIPDATGAAPYASRWPLSTGFEAGCLTVQ